MKFDDKSRFYAILHDYVSTSLEMCNQIAYSKLLDMCYSDIQNALEGYSVYDSAFNQQKINSIMRDFERYHLGKLGFYTRFKNGEKGLNVRKITNEITSGLVDIMKNYPQ